MKSNQLSLAAITALCLASSVSAAVVPKPMSLSSLRGPVALITLSGEEVSIINKRQSTSSSTGEDPSLEDLKDSIDEAKQKLDDKIREQIQKAKDEAQDKLDHERGRVEQEKKAEIDRLERELEDTERKLQETLEKSEGGGLA
jgi:hypothetical protein